MSGSMVGALEAARITEAAFAYAFPDGVPEDRDMRQARCFDAEENDPQYHDKINVYSRVYCRDPDQIYTLLEAFARKHGFLVE